YVLSSCSEYVSLVVNYNEIFFIALINSDIYLFFSALLFFSAHLSICDYLLTIYRSNNNDPAPVIRETCFLNFLLISTVSCVVNEVSIKNTSLIFFSFST